MRRGEVVEADEVAPPAGRYNGPIPGGGMALGEKVQIVIEVEADLVTA